MSTEMSGRGFLNGMRRFPVLYGVAVSLFWALLGTIVLGIYAHMALPSEGSVWIAAYTIHCLAVFIGGITASRSSRVRGWYVGGFTAFLYALIMIGIGLVAFDTFTFDANGLLRLVIFVGVGAFSGVIGVNTVGTD